MKKVYNAYCKAEEFLFSFLFAVMVALVFSSAIARGIGKPLAWSLDVAQLLLCWTSLVGADVAFRHDKFIGLDLFTRKMPVKVQKDRRARADAGGVLHLHLLRRDAFHQELEALVPDASDQLFVYYHRAARHVYTDDADQYSENHRQGEEFQEERRACHGQGHGIRGEEEKTGS